jgi:hypothetical protein
MFLVRMNGTARFKNVGNCLNTNIYTYLETFGGQSSNPYLNVVHFSTPELIRNLWQLNTAVFLHWYLIHAVPLSKDVDATFECVFLALLAASSANVNEP